MTKRILHMLFAVSLLLIVACASEKVPEDSSVWIINKMELNPDNHVSDYIESLNENWIKHREEGISQGYINSYDIVTIPTMGGKWEFLLMTEYVDDARIEAFKNDFTDILDTVNPDGVVLVNGKGPRELATQINTQILTNTEFKQLMATVRSGV